jgi:hypothetical protein
MSEPLTPEAVAAMVREAADLRERVRKCSPINAPAVLMLCDHVRTLAAEVRRLNVAQPQPQTQRKP